MMRAVQASQAGKRLKRNARHRRRGLALIEATMAVFVVAVAVSAGLYAATASAKSRELAADSARAMLACRSLFDEIMAQNYADPQTPGAALGRDTSESLSGSRLTLDDVDDYATFSELTLRDHAGTTLGLPAPWRRQARVEWVQPASPNTSSAVETGMKRVRVQITSNGKILAELTGYRLKAWDDAQRRLGP